MAEQTLLAAFGQAAVYAEKHSTPASDVQSPLEEVNVMICVSPYYLHFNLCTLVNLKVFLESTAMIWFATGGKDCEASLLCSSCL